MLEPVNWRGKPMLIFIIGYGVGADDSRSAYERVDYHRPYSITGIYAKIILTLIVEKEPKPATVTALYKYCMLF